MIYAKFLCSIQYNIYLLLTEDQVEKCLYIISINISCNVIQIYGPKHEADKYYFANIGTGVARKAAWTNETFS